MDINKGNKEFIKLLDSNESLKKRRDSLINGQHPETLIITCSDSRVAPEIIFNCFLGDIFVIRTAGNVINEGELATIEYAIEHLKVKHIIVLGHTHCGAIHASIHHEKSVYMSPILKRIQNNIGDIQDECLASQINAQKEVLYIKEKFPQYKGTLEYKIYDIESSKIK